MPAFQGLLDEEMQPLTRNAARWRGWIVEVREEDSVLGRASSRGISTGNGHYTSVGLGPFLRMYL